MNMETIKKANDKQISDTINSKKHTFSSFSIMSFSIMEIRSQLLRAGDSIKVRG